jgi:hypothetical protein
MSTSPICRLVTYYEGLPVLAEIDDGEELAKHHQLVLQAQALELGDAMLARRQI